MTTETPIIHAITDLKMLPSTRMQLLIRKGVQFNIVDGQLEVIFPEGNKYKPDKRKRLRHLISMKPNEHIKALHAINERKHLVKGEDLREIKPLPPEKKRGPMLRLPKTLDTVDKILRFQNRVISYVTRERIDSNLGMDLIKMAQAQYETIKDSLFEARVTSLEEEKKIQTDGNL